MRPRVLKSLPVLKSVVLGRGMPDLAVKRAWFSSLPEAGQPTHFSHPHLLKEGEILPGIHKLEFEERRDLCLRILQRFSDADHLLIVPSATKQYMSHNVPYVFRQNTDFLFLTGCQDSDSVLTLNLQSEGEGETETVLFLNERGATERQWDGPCTRVEDAPEILGIDDVRPLRELAEYLDEFPFTNRPLKVWYDSLQLCGADVRETVDTWLEEKKPSPKIPTTPAFLTHSVRVIKSNAEINMMKKTCRIASEAIEVCMRRSFGGISEHELFAIVDYECRMRGANFLAYPPVVAGGTRASVVHYVSNNQIVRPGELVLMDAGCEYYGYCSDITRTWPVNGKFSHAQALIYQIVLEIQEDLLEMCLLLPTLDELQQKMIDSIGEKLILAGVVKYKEELRTNYLVGNKYCPHHVSHYLGMDVHDCSSLHRKLRMKAGMIITLEPAIYISPNEADVHPEFRGICVRIEDDILITEDGLEILTKHCPKGIDDIEYLMKDNKKTIS